MLIGLNNLVNEKLVKEISHVYPITFRDVSSILDNSKDSYTPRILLVNLMDIGSNEEALLIALKNRYPGRMIIGIHCFQMDNMIQKTLDKGYDDYISVFKVSEEFSRILEKHQLNYDTTNL